MFLGPCGDNFDFLVGNPDVLIRQILPDFACLHLEHAHNHVVQNLALNSLNFRSMEVHIFLQIFRLNVVLFISLSFDISLNIKFVFIAIVVECVKKLIKWRDGSLKSSLELVKFVPGPLVLIRKFSLIIWIWLGRLPFWPLGSFETHLSVILEQMAKKFLLKLADFLERLDSVIKNHHYDFDDVSGRCGETGLRNP